MEVVEPVTHQFTGFLLSLGYPSFLPLEKLMFGQLHIDEYYEVLVSPQSGLEIEPAILLLISDCS